MNTLKKIFAAILSLVIFSSFATGASAATKKKLTKSIKITAKKTLIKMSNSSKYLSVKIACVDSDVASEDIAYTSAKFYIVNDGTANYSLSCRGNKDRRMIYYSTRNITGQLGINKSMLCNENYINVYINNFGNLQTSISCN